MKMKRAWRFLALCGLVVLTVFAQQGRYAPYQEKLPDGVVDWDEGWIRTDVEVPLRTGIPPQQARVEAQRVAVLAEHPGAETVERGHQGLFGAGHEGLGPLAHLSRGLVRKRDGQNLPGGDAAAHQVRHPPRDDAGLAAAGPGQHQQRAVDVRDGLGLRGRQSFEDVHNKCLSAWVPEGQEAAFAAVAVSVSRTAAPGNFFHAGRVMPLL